MFNRPRIIPVLLIDDRDLIKTINFKKPTYLGDPVNALKIFNRKGIDEMAVLDISASKKGIEPDFELLTDMASEAFMPLSYGGGIKTLEQVRKLLAIGYEKVVLNTSLVEDEQLVKDAVALAGSQSVVASIDAKLVKGQYKCVICDGTKVIDMTPVELAKHAAELGVGEIFLNSIDRDGMMTGYDTELINQVVNAVDIPVTACGGAGSISDLKDALQNGHAHAAAGGSMFVYYGRLKAVLITAPTEQELTEAGIYTE
ncbi:AglZ/HisF2 family acetamidino modification protein [Pseudobutyrivibrio ruminis]|uniref:AglZ/HisF2 family acetamidino modification protein n=1 Tax=Pseudobutyrivibrio ruminis TaxID=46206 RepID=UPI00041DBFFB|nr:AglZ/HisF2 family acetamidino modification protein [Pseudobutyrivibrio ruminis]